MNDLPIFAQWTLFGVQIVTVLVVIAYVKASFSMAKANADAVQEMKNSRELQNRPYIGVRAEWDGLWELMLTNRGHTAARAVSFSVDRPLLLHDGLDFADSVIGRHGVPYMAPGAEVRMLFRVERELFAETPSPLLVWNVTSSYTDDVSSPAVRYNETYILDLNIYGDIRSINRKTVHDLAKNIEQVAGELKSIKGVISANRR